MVIYFIIKTKMQGTTNQTSEVCSHHDIPAHYTWWWDSSVTIWNLKNKNQLDATYCFIILMIGSTCFGYYCAHHQELTTIVLITTWAFRILGCCWLEVRCRQAIAITCSSDTYPACLHLTANQQPPKNRTAHVVISTIVVSSWRWAQ